MSFNSSIVKSAVGSGAGTTFTAPLAAFKGTLIALNGITSGSTASAAGAVLTPGGSQNIEFDSLCAMVETNLTTNTITATTKWQVSQDGTNWLDVLGMNSAANVTKAAAGTGSLITTQYVQAFPGWNPAFPYVRLAVQVGAATGAAGDNVTVSYNWRRRFVAAVG